MFGIILLVLQLLGVLCLLLLVAVIIFICMSYYNNIYKLKLCTSQEKLDGKTVILTGSSAGIGKAAAEDFARRGAHLIMACRNADKAQKVADDIISKTGNKNVLVKILDTSSLQSVRTFAKGILESEKRLDVLVLNAGIIGPADHTLTEDGLELTLATNHYGHFLLANLLIGLVKKSAPSRIVVTTSSAHTFIKSFNIKDIEFSENEYSSWDAYAVSKLLNVYFTKHLASLTADSGVTVNCFCPGLVASDIFKKSKGGLITHLLPLLCSLTGRTIEQGAQTMVYLAVDKECAEKNGRYYVDCKIGPATPIAEDIGMAKKIWEKSEGLVKLSQEEISHVSETLEPKEFEKLNQMTSRITELADNDKEGFEKEVVQDLLDEKITEISEVKVEPDVVETVKEGENKIESTADVKITKIFDDKNIDDVVEKVKEVLENKIESIADVKIRETFGDKDKADVVENVKEVLINKIESTPDVKITEIFDDKDKVDVVENVKEVLINKIELTTDVKITKTFDDKNKADVVENVKEVLINKIESTTDVKITETFDDKDKADVVENVKEVLVSKTESTTDDKITENSYDKVKPDFAEILKEVVEEKIESTTDAKITDTFDDKVKTDAEGVKESIENRIESTIDVKVTETSDDWVKITAEEEVKVVQEDKLESVSDSIVVVSLEEIISAEKSTDSTEVMHLPAQKVQEICTEDVKQCKEKV